MPYYGAVGQYVEEEEPLVISDAREYAKETPKKVSWKFIIGILFSFIIIGLALFASSIYISDTLSSSNIDESDFLINFSLNRIGYLPVDSIYGSGDSNIISYEIFKNFSGIIEPYSPMKMTIANTIADTKFTYTIISDSDVNQKMEGTFLLDDEINKVSSNELKFSCIPFDTYTVSIVASTSNGFGSKIISSFTGSLLCMYVRREIRSLQPSDLSDVMDALYVLYSTNETEGTKKYGSKFHSSTYLCDWHFFTAAQADADHIHEGNGFLPQHIKATNLVEGAMQSVNPAVSLPYWDYTIEGESDTYIYDSPIFTPEMFGTITLPKNISIGFSYSQDNMLDAAIPDGRWAYILAEKNTKYNSINQPFGYLRSPWNMNPSPYVSRYVYTGDSIDLPACSDFVNLLNYTDLNDFLFDIALDSHGHTHLLPGGQFGCELIRPAVELGYVTGGTFMYLCSQWGFVIKEMYRHNLITYPTGCEIKTYDYSGISNCTFYCVVSDDDIAEYIVNDLAQYGLSVTDEGSLYLTDFICNGDASKIFVGDHLESASPADPSFWPIHPSLERALHAKYLSGGFENNVWSNDPSVNCQRNYCFIHHVYSNHTACCYGHYSEDRSIDYVNGDENKYIGIPNRQVMESTDPTTRAYNFPYIYENFQWEHCEGSEYSMTRILHQLKQKYLS